MWQRRRAVGDITDCRRGRALERFSIFVEACGLTRAERRLVAQAVVPNHDWTYAIVTESAAAGQSGLCRSLARSRGASGPSPALVPAPSEGSARGSALTGTHTRWAAGVLRCGQPFRLS